MDPSFRNEWKRRFPSERLDNIEGADEVDSSEIKLIRTSGKVKLQAVVTSTFYDQKIDDIRRYVHTIRVPESRFVYVK